MTAALRNQLESVVGDLRVAYSRLGQIPPPAMNAPVFARLQEQYANLMDISGHLHGELAGMGDSLGADMAPAADINRFQAEVELFVSAAESELARVFEQSPGSPQLGAAPGAASGGGWMKWAAAAAAIAAVGAGGYWLYQRRSSSVTPAF